MIKLLPVLACLAFGCIDAPATGVAVAPLSDTGPPTRGLDPADPDGDMPWHCSVTACCWVQDGHSCCLVCWEDTGCFFDC